MNPIATALILLAVLGLTLWLDARVPRLFHYLPVPFWCYFIPMALATAGILPADSPTYKFLTTYGLCACLFLLLLNVNLPAILRVGPTATEAMLVGVAGIAAGAVVSFALFHRRLPESSWQAVGVLSAS